MTIDRQMEAIHIAETKLYEPVASSVISTKTLQINCICASYFELQELNKQGFSAVVYGSQFDDCCDLGVVIHIEDNREAWKELANDYLEVMEELGRDIKEMK